MGKAEGFELGKAEGFGIGKQEGIEVAIHRVAKKMLEKGKTISEIAEMTGLTEEEIRGL